jgi:heterodisulfide reductase subunit A2
MLMERHIIVIGAGVAGMESAARLSELGFRVTLIEKKEEVGGHVKKWDFLFPDKRPAYEIINALRPDIEDLVDTRFSCEVQNISRVNGSFDINLSTGDNMKADVLLLTTGFDLFDARKKEEYGYGIYENVITAAELEEQFMNKIPIRTAAGKIPRRIAFVHCVGSRDEKAGNEYCSKVCCVTGVKQAMKMREALPNSEVFCFYMDLRMFGRYFESLYRESQEKWGVQYIRGRLSEASENFDHRIVAKLEDTLAGKPLKMTVDLLVLLTGFVPSEGTRKMIEMLKLDKGDDRFIKPVDEHLRKNYTNIPGVFIAGASGGPKCIAETINDARAAAIEIAAYLRKKIHHD